MEAGRKIVEVDGGSWEADGEKRMDESGRRTEAGRRTMKADEKLEANANGVRRMVAAYGARWLVGVGWWNLVGGR